MNPASAASAVEISTGASGMAIAGFVVLSLVIVGLALALLQSRWPKSKAAQAFNDIEGYAKHFGEHVESVAAEIEPTVLSAEIGVGKEVNSMLGKLELALTSTTSEDAAIAAAETYLARVTAEVQNSIATANAQKAAKLAAIQLHISNLTTGSGS